VIVQACNAPTPDPRAHASLRLVDTQRRPVTWALLAAAVFFTALTVKNLSQGDHLVGGLCALAVAMALMYARVIYRQLPNPLSDPVFALVVWVILGTTVYKRDLVGVLWAPALMLMMHLVARRGVSLVFDALVLATVAAHCAINHDVDTTFRVMVILLITSAFAHIYAQNVEDHHRVLDEQRQHLDLMVRCAAVGGMEWATNDDRGTPSDRLAQWMGLPSRLPAGGRTRLVDHLAPEHRSELTRTLSQLTAEPTEPHGSRHAPPQDLRLLRADGTDVWLHAEFMALSNAEGKPAKVVATFIDISRLRAAEADTLAALKRQQELNELRARFVAMTSHEFRTPLAAILSSAELLQHYGERLADAEKQTVLQGIHDGVHRMTHMLDRILLINKADAQMLECRPQPVALASSIRQIADELESDGGDTRRRIHVQVTPPDAHPWVDPKLLHHILGNLMSNALKYSPAHQPVSVTAHVDGHRLCLVVEDKGIGIPAQDMPELFEPFHRGGNVGDLQGTGLGLTIVKKSAELHGGHVEVSSQPHQGTRFTVFLRQGAPA
jgi:signal transduction histidine kinase